MNDIKFEHDDDKLFIKALLRSAKEANVLYIINDQTVKDIYEKCLRCRRCFPSQSIYNNAMYWAFDCGFFNVNIMYRLLLISSIDKNRLTENDIMNFKLILCRLFSNATPKLLKNIYVLDLFDLAAKNLGIKPPFVEDTNFMIDRLKKYKNVTPL